MVPKTTEIIEFNGRSSVTEASPVYLMTVSSTMIGIVIHPAPPRGMSVVVAATFMDFLIAR